MSSKHRRLKIYRDELKERHTSHWDWDYMTAEEIEQSIPELKLTQPRVDDRSQGYWRFLLSRWQRICQW